MAKQKSKTEILKDIQAERRLLNQAIAEISSEDMTQPGVVGEWSVKDVLAHLVAWEQLFIGWYQAGLEGKVPEINPVGMSKKAMDELNQQIFVQWNQHSLEDVLSKFQGSYQLVIAAVMEIAEEDMFTPRQYAWTGRYTLADYIMGNTGNHYRWAKDKIRTWLKMQQ